MKLVRVDFDHVDGLPSGLHIDDLSSGLNIILGGNGSGKSSFVSIARRSLWPAKSRRSFHARSHCVVNGEAVRAAVMNHRVNWGEQDGSPAPPLPAEHLSPCFVLGIRDLLGEANATDEELARQIRRAMRGGFDLDLVRKEFKLSDHGIRTVRKELLAASTQVAELRRQFRELAKEEDHLAELELRFQEARDAELKLSLLDVVDRLLTHRHQLAQVTIELDKAPVELSALRGGEADNVEQLRELLAEHEGLRANLIREHAELCSQLESLDLPEAGIDPESISEQALDAQQLSRTEANLADLVSELAAARKQASQSKQLLLGDDGSERAPLTLDEINELDDYLASSLSNSSEVRSIRRLLEQITSADEDLDAGSLTAAEHALSAWLKAPGEQSQPVGPSWLRWFAFAAMVAGLIAATLVSPALLALTTLGLGVFLAQYLTARSNGGSNRTRGEARVAFDLTGLAGPSSWSSQGVSDRVNEIRSELSRAHREALDKQRRSELSARLDELLEEHNKTEELGEALRLATGLSLRSRPMARVEAAHRMAQHRRCQALTSELADRVNADQARLQAGSAVIRGFLREHGVEISEQAGPSALSAQLAALGERNHDFARTRDAAERLSTDIARFDGIIQTTRKKIVTIFSTLGLKEDDTEGFEELLAGVEGYQALVARSSELEITIARCESDLHSEPEWLSLRPEDLARERTRLEELRASFADRNDQWQRVKGDLRRARAGHQLEDARATQGALEEKLFDLHQDALVGEAAGFLLDDVEQSYRRSSRPLVLQEAMELFSDFTQARYQVEIAGGEQPRLVALDSSSKRTLELGELSDGTRIQLLLAVRLAFATQHSQGNVLPIFLDEALSTTDPVRFKAIGSSLLAMVERGQQVFYLTANPADLAGWHQLCSDRGVEQPKVVLLGELRVEMDAIDHPNRLRVTEPEVPLPGDQSAAEYGALLRPHEPNCFDVPGALDLYFLLSDRLELLYSLRSQGIKVVGQWEQLSTSPALKRYLADEADQRSVSARVKMAHAYIENWRIGRGKPMTRVDLEESGSVSDKYIDQLTQCLEATGGSGKELLETIASPAVKGFRKAAAAKLEKFMLEEGFLDRRGPLSPLVLELETVAHLTPELADGLLNTDIIRQFVRLIDRARPTPPSQNT